MRMAQFSLFGCVLSLIVASMLVGCGEGNLVRQGAALRPITPSASPTASFPLPTATATLMVIAPPVWALYQEPHHYFSLEYPSEWQIEPGEPPLANSPVWSFFGLLATGTVTQEIEIVRDSIPIHPSQTLQDWYASKGPGEAAATIVEQKTFQLNGREVYFVKASAVSQGIGQTTYFRCGTWVWVVTSGIQATAVAVEFDLIYEHVINTFTPKCY